MFDKKYCVRCGNPISNDSVYCSRCGTKQDICENKFCKQCGKKIDLYAEFCPACGTKQNNIKDKVVNALSSLSSSVKNLSNMESNESIEIPMGCHFCFYCGKVKSEDNFNRTLGEEFNMCNQCYNRGRNIEYVVTLISALIALVLIIVLLCNLADRRDFWADKLGMAVALTIITILFSTLVCKFSIFLINKVLEFTSLRVTLSDKREKRLCQTLDVNGKSILSQPDIPHGYYRCPSCEKFHLLESSECIKNEDNDFFIGASWYVGSYYITTSKEFYSHICPSCYKFKKINKYIKIAVALICFILAAIIFVNIEGFSWKILIISVFFGSIAAYIFSWMVSYIYKVFIYLLLRKNLFYRFEKAKKYGALYYSISVEDIRRIMQK